MVKNVFFGEFPWIFVTANSNIQGKPFVVYLCFIFTVTCVKSALGQLKDLTDTMATKAAAIRQLQSLMANNLTEIKDKIEQARSQAKSVSLLHTHVYPHISVLWAALNVMPVLTLLRSNLEFQSVVL